MPPVCQRLPPFGPPRTRLPVDDAGAGGARSEHDGGMPPRGSSAGSRHAPDQETAASPAATRASRSRWRDPRLVVGVAVVAVCGLLGARFLGGADDTVAV